MIIVTGSLAYDQILNLPGKFSSYILPEKIHNLNVSFACDTHTRSFGGNAGNQAYSLALLGTKPLIVATAGNDFAPYRKFLRKNTIDTTFIRIIKHELTAMGIAITDEMDNQIWGFSKGAMKYAKDLSLKPIVTRLKKETDKLFIVITPNEPLAMIRYIDECIAMKIDFAFDPAFYVPILSRETLKKGVAFAKIVFGNDYEIGLLEKKLGVTKEAFFSEFKRQSLSNQIWVTTLGEKGSIIDVGQKDGSIEATKIKPAKVKNAVDPTGAGDSYRAGFMAGFIKGKNLKTCGQMGSVAAAYTVENYGTMEHSYSKNEFWKRYSDNYKLQNNALRHSKY